MARLLLLIHLVVLAHSFSYGQISVYQDKDGEVFTTVDEYGPGTASATLYKKLIYAGSPFLTFPVWQPGRVRLDEAGKYVSCNIAYDLVTSTVLCRFAGDSTIQTLRPERFTIGSDEFIRQQNKSAGLDYKIYAKTLYSGRTKLLLTLSKRNDPHARAANSNGYEKEMAIAGSYVLTEKYYIRKGDARPEPVMLTKNALLSVLYEQADKLGPRLAGRRLSPADVVAILPYYDSLMTAQRVANAANDSASAGTYVMPKAPLSNDPLFTETLHQEIRYPDMAWTQAVYGRVYAGFTISQQGHVANITILSPDNSGMGFIEAVRNGLTRLPVQNPSLAGSYVLPVAFTYTNQTEKGQTHAPINRLPDNRLAGRIVLDEFTVPIVVTKPVQTSREVWGYFK